MNCHLFDQDNNNSLVPPSLEILRRIFIKFASFSLCFFFGKFIASASLVAKNGSTVCHRDG